MKAIDWVILVALLGCVGVTITLLLTYIWSIHAGWMVTLAFNQYNEGWIELVLLAVIGFIGWAGLFHWSKRLIKR
jgi:hypothetical protein